jgi:hypothetical protein
MRTITTITILMTLSTAFAETATKCSVHPYAVYYDYEKTAAKEATAGGGVYAFYGYGDHHSFEGDVAYTHISYDGPLVTSSFDIEQTDLTFVYNNYSLSDLKLRGGVHGILSDDDQTDESYVLFAGISRYKLYKYDMGLDAYVSSYDDYAPDALTVLQLTATGGFNFGDYYTTGSFYARTRGHYIQLSDDIGYNDKAFSSIEQSLFFYYKKWTLETFAWAGKQVFGVQKDGFVVYNLGEKHTAAYGGSVAHALGKASSLKLEVSRGNFKELGSSGTAHFLKAMLMLSHTF